MADEGGLSLLAEHGAAKGLSIFVDESGDRGGKVRYYLLTMVMHDQTSDIAEKLSRYEDLLLRSGLPDIPFHSDPLLNGHGPYEGMPLASRKKLLYSFNVLVQRLGAPQVDLACGLDGERQGFGAGLGSVPRSCRDTFGPAYLPFSPTFVFTYLAFLASPP